VTAPDDPYALLGVERGVSVDELRAARRRAALRNHPDKEGGSTELMRRINAAFDAVMAELRCGPDGPAPAGGGATGGAHGRAAQPRRRVVHDRGAPGRRVRGAARRGDVAR
jgi:hypothetical protein